MARNYVAETLQKRLKTVQTELAAHRRAVATMTDDIQKAETDIAALEEEQQQIIDLIGSPNA